MQKRKPPDNTSTPPPSGAGETTLNRAFELVELIAEKVSSLGVKAMIGAYLLLTVWNAKFGAHENKTVEAPIRSFAADVVDAGGNPLSHAQIILMDRTHGKRQVLRPDRNGKIQTVLEDDALYEIQYPQSDGSTIRIKIPVGQSMELTITLEPIPKGRHPRTQTRTVQKSPSD